MAIEATKQPLVVGKFGAPYGVRGWIKVYSVTESRHGIVDYHPWLIQQQGLWLPVDWVDWKPQGNHLLVKLAGLDDCESAQTMVNCSIAIDPSQLSPLPHGEYYWCELLGCHVINRQDDALGIVSQILETGSNDVLVVKAPATDAYKKCERLIPWIEPQVVQQINLDKQQIIVDWDPEF